MSWNWMNCGVLWAAKTMWCGCGLTCALALVRSSLGCGTIIQPAPMRCCGGRCRTTTSTVSALLMVGTPTRPLFLLNSCTSRRRKGQPTTSNASTSHCGNVWPASPAKRFRSPRASSCTFCLSNASSCATMSNKPEDTTHPSSFSHYPFPVSLSNGRQLHFIPRAFGKLGAALDSKNSSGAYKRRVQEIEDF